MGVIDSAVSWVIAIANDNSHGYDQIHRWDPDYDCSSLVLSAYEQAGVPVREAHGSYTGDMRRAFVVCGFRDIPFTRGMTLVKGDVLMYHRVENGKVHGHTVLYIGNNKIVQASINEKGTATGGKTGDQTGREIYVGNFYVPNKYGWDYVLRYNEEEVRTVDVALPVLRKGSRGAEVGTVQTLLNALGYVGTNKKPLTIDHDFGANTECAIKNFQKASGMNDDGICGQKTWSALLSANY